MTLLLQLKSINSTTKAYVIFPDKTRIFETLTITSFPTAKNCILRGPDISNRLAICAVTSLIFCFCISVTVWEGKIKVASPEWTPAFSTCSDIAWTITYRKNNDFYVKSKTYISILQRKLTSLFHMFQKIWGNLCIYEGTQERNTYLHC